MASEITISLIRRLNIIGREGSQLIQNHQSVMLLRALKELLLAISKSWQVRTISIDQGQRESTLIDPFSTLNKDLSSYHIIDGQYIYWARRENFVKQACQLEQKASVRHGKQDLTSINLLGTICTALIKKRLQFQLQMV